MYHIDCPFYFLKIYKKINCIQTIPWVRESIICILANKNVLYISVNSLLNISPSVKKNAQAGNRIQIID